MLPVWQKAVKPYVESGELVAIGVVQEQHPDRTRLYRQWRELDWPIFVDSLNTIEHVKVVPLPMAIDEAGFVVDTQFRPAELEAFMSRPANDSTVADAYNRAEPPDFDLLKQASKESSSSDAWRDLGEAYFNFGAKADLELAVESYENAVKVDPGDGRAHFGLGTALRRRYESTYRRPDDGQSAVEHWGRALDIDPNHYIWRRRLQQYGPRLDKPYNFYFWVARARETILARGEAPFELRAEPMGSEISAPQRDREQVVVGHLVNPDPGNKITRDQKSLVGIETLVTPNRVQPGHRIRGRVTFRLNESTGPFWNNEADDLMMWVDLPKGLTLVEQSLAYPNPETPETQELRHLEFEAQIDDSIGAGDHSISGYALYYVCEDEGKSVV